MEKNFYTDDFEQLLKDTTEDFRMYPSRKVWHSIYNDLHPAKKWPSFAVCLLLITAILYVGINNNNTINADADNLLLSTLSPSEKGKNAMKVKAPAFALNQVSREIFQQSPASAGAKPDNTELSANDPGSMSPGTVNYTQSVVNFDPYLPVITQKTVILPRAEARELKSETFINITPVVPSIPDIIPIDKKTVQTTMEERLPAADKTVAETDGGAINPETGSLTSIKTAPNTPAVAAVGSGEIKKLSTEDKTWIENFAFHNKRNGNKWKTKFSTLVYATPSIGYRILNKNNNFEPVNALLIRSSATSVDADDAISQQAALNFESGATGILDISRRLRIKAGVQFNYTNYISFADRLSHPTQTNVLLNDLATGHTMLVPFVTNYGNQGGDNRIRLNNKTAQFYIPLGADYKLAGSDRFKWYIGATIQPTYVAGGTTYLVSSDYKHYVNAPSMLRAWNLNAGFESFISYKAPGGSVINIGPQFRYQLLSTYSNRYTYSENLYNIGIKVGITRKF